MMMRMMRRRRMISLGLTLSKKPELIIKFFPIKKILGAREIDLLTKTLPHKSREWSLIPISHIKS